MIENPFKTLSEIIEPDPRSLSFVGNLTDIHAVLDEITLRPEVPPDVAQLFETAKNVSLYSWFVYRFHQVAESVAFQALELGLRVRFDGVPKSRRDQLRGLQSYLNYAKSHGWLDDAGFSSIRQVASHRIRMRTIFGLTANEMRNPIDTIPEPTEAEIDQELSTFSYLEGLLHVIPKHRNDLAHGSPMVAPTSRKILRIVGDILNQLYRHSNATPRGPDCGQT